MDGVAENTGDALAKLVEIVAESCRVDSKEILAEVGQPEPVFIVRDQFAGITAIWRSLPMEARLIAYLLSQERGDRENEGWERFEREC